MKFYVTTPIYYVNARPHIGHAYTTLAADVLARWHKQQGDATWFLTGTDEHGAKVAEAAAKAGEETQAFTDAVADQFRSAWKNLQIEYSDFIRTTEERHERGVAAFLAVLKNNSALYEGEYRGLYCTGCETFITAKELAGGLCPIHHTAPEEVAEKNWFFKLADYKQSIGELIESDRLKIRPDGAKKEALGLLKQDLEDFSISREKVKWGIKLPWDETQTVYVWVDALLNYLTAISYPPAEKWPADLQLIGKDILKFHAIYWPAMLLSAGLKPPRELFVHGYFTIDGQKMGKSAGNVIDPNDLVAEYGADGARYLLLSQFPFGQDGDVKRGKFNEQYNAFFANGLGNIVARTATLIEKHFPGEAVTLKTETDTQDFDSLMSECKFDEALKSNSLRIAALDKELEDNKPWQLIKTDKDRAKNILFSTAGEIVLIARQLRPFFPETSEKIIKQFTASGIKKGEPLFPRK